MIIFLSLFALIVLASMVYLSGLSGAAISTGILHVLSFGPIVLVLGIIILPIFGIVSAASKGEAEKKKILKRLREKQKKEKEEQKDVRE